MRKLSYFLVGLVACVSGYAQSFTHQSSLSGINQTGLYKVPLDPGSMQYMRSDLHDLRIMDSANHEVPYVVLSEPLLKAKSDFVSYEIVSQTHFKNYSEIIIHNVN